jgi:hypothetical protein
MHTSGTFCLWEAFTWKCNQTWVGAREAVQAVQCAVLSMSSFKSGVGQPQYGNQPVSFQWSEFVVRIRVLMFDSRPICLLYCALCSNAYIYRDENVSKCDRTQCCGLHHCKKHRQHGDHISLFSLFQNTLINGIIKNNICFPVTGISFFWETQQNKRLPPPSEDGNRSSLRNVVSSYLGLRRMDRVQKRNDCDFQHCSHFVHPYMKPTESGPCL